MNANKIKSTINYSRGAHETLARRPGAQFIYSFNSFYFCFQRLNALLYRSHFDNIRFIFFFFFNLLLLLESLLFFFALIHPHNIHNLIQNWKSVWQMWLIDGKSLMCARAADFITLYLNSMHALTPARARAHSFTPSNPIKIVTNSQTKPTPCIRWKFTQKPRIFYVYRFYLFFLRFFLLLFNWKSCKKK